MVIDIDEEHAFIWSVAKTSAKRIPGCRSGTIVRFVEATLEWYEGEPMLSRETISK